MFGIRFPRPQADWQKTTQSGGRYLPLLSGTPAERQQLADKGMAAPTFKRHLTTLHAMFNRALRWHLFEERIPAASPGMLPEHHREAYPTAEQTQALVPALDLEASQDAAWAR
jgi:hypothetical protein